MARAAGGLLRAGAAIIGGCCGTTPDHIRQFRVLLDNPATWQEANS